MQKVKSTKVSMITIYERNDRKLSKSLHVFNWIQF